jgi:ABC-type Fe3+/spermidine/putrescine transport system ATPase subunit
VLQNGKLVTKGNSRKLYENPPSYYVASLFGEVNQLKQSHFFDIEEDKTLFLYPHQLKVVEEGKMKVIVKQSYFKGSYHLIKAAFEGKAIFFDHNSALELNQEVSLEMV